MKKIIHRLRKQKEEDRRNILHLSIFIVACLIILVWTFGLSSTIAKDDNLDKGLEPIVELTTDLNQDLQEFKLEN